MSDNTPVIVRCASGNNAFTDCMVLPHGDLVRIVGHPQMDFDEAGARALMDAIAAKLPSLEVALSPPPQQLPSTLRQAGEESCGDAIVDEARAMLLQRSKLGQKKYGRTLERNDLDFIDWLRMSVEEGLDQNLYLLRDQRV